MKKLPPYLAARRLWLALFLAALAVVGCAQLDQWQRRAIFAIQTDSRAWWREPSEDTRVYDLVLRNGEKVRAWYLPHPDPDAAAVLYLHGARWNLNGSAFRIERWAEMGYSVLAIDYRGFGESSPALPSEASATEDALAGLRELARLQPDASRRFVYGHSLGGAIAMNVANQARRPAFAGLIVESSFTNVGAMLSTLRWGWLPGLGLLVTQPFDSLAKAARLESPVLFIHGTGDQVVPHEMSDQLHAAAARVPAPFRRLVKIEGASHSGASRAGPQYEEAVRRFTADVRAAYGTTALHQQHDGGGGEGDVDDAGQDHHQAGDGALLGGELARLGHPGAVRAHAQ
ncbi:alpha/beta fold hydrolase [Orrella sp. JC864]|uniref:alpha/beta hydrolase n=1 Tax=Orrella sp. JC864 TaxID=3120298 RepID=UPI00300A7ACF